MEDLVLAGENPCRSHVELPPSDRQILSSRPLSKSEHDTTSKSPVSILRSSTNKLPTLSPPESLSTSELPDQCKNLKRGVHFSDGSSPGSAGVPEDQHRKVPCYEPSPAAVSDHALNLPHSSWEDLLRHSKDMHSLKSLLDQTAISGNLEPGMDDIE